MLVGSGAAYSFVNTEAAAYVAAMTVQPDSTRKAAIDQLFTSLKAGTLGSVNLLTVLDGLWLFAAHDSQAALLNALAPSATPAAPSAAPTFTTDVGYAGNGTSSYVDLSYNPTTYPSAKFLQNSASFGLWSNSAGQSGVSAGGWYDGSDGTTMFPRSTTDTVAFRVNQAFSSQSAASSVTSGLGLFAADRSASNATKVTINGVAKTITSNANQASVAVNNASLKVGTISGSSFSTAQICAAFAGGSLGADNVHLDLYNALRAYMTAVGVP